MRAAVVRAFGGPENIEIVHNWVKPILSSDEQIIVRNYASGVNPVDTYIRSGQYAQLPTLPYTPGKDGAGVVVEVGSRVTNAKVGDRVWYAFSSGSAAEYTIASKAFPLPKDVSYEEGASIGVPYMTAFRALFTIGHAKKGDSVLVHGASGGVGSAAVQLAKWKGLHVVGTAGTEPGIQHAKRLGSDDVFNHRHDNYVTMIKEKYPNGFDIILEMAAHKNLNVDLGLLAFQGKIVVIGNRGEVTLNARHLMAVEGSIFGVALGRSTADEMAEIGEGICNFLTSSSSRPVIQKKYRLEELPQAHADIMSDSGSVGKLIVVID